MDVLILVLPLVIVTAVVFTEAYKCLLFLVYEIRLVSELGTSGALGRVCADGGLQCVSWRGARRGEARGVPHVRLPELRGFERHELLLAGFRRSAAGAHVPSAGALLAQHGGRRPELGSRHQLDLRAAGVQIQ